jgi:hypothetical protein
MIYMTTASNLYASRVFSEHPIASWPLDDDVSYISLISEAQRSFDLWTLTNCTYVDYLPFPDNPFPNGPFPYSTFSEVTATDPNIVLEAFSPNLFNLQDLSQLMNTFAINMYLYTDGSIQSYEYGYRYLDPFTGSYIEETLVSESVSSSSWIRVGATFNPPNVNASAQVVLRVTFAGSASPSVVMNGLSVGQWSEQVSNKSLGASTELINSELQTIIGPYYGVPIEAYGISDKDGYILSNDGMLLATNIGVPMVYGSDNVTRLKSNIEDLTNTIPAVVIPGCGFLNESGKYNSYTFEMWIRLENNQVQDRRIWGPLSSNDGLYISRGYLTLVIGNSFQSYFVSDWYRPMLVHITVRENAASVLINGEEVISFTFDTSSLVLPSITEDWIGFYCYYDMPLYEIDCVSILPYIIPSAVAKKRFAWGQGVESPENINTAYQGVASYLDYPYAQYTANKVYPDLQYWDSGYFENLVASKRSLSLPNYQLPFIQLSDKTTKEFYSDNHLIQVIGESNFVSFRPNATWENPSYMLFTSLNVLTDVVRGMWGVFEVESDISEERPLIVLQRINDQSTRIEITINGLEVSYRLYQNNVLYPLEFSFNVSIDVPFSVGFHFPRLFDTYAGIIGEFFGDPSQVQMFVGGNGTDTFEGKIYTIGFSNQSNLNEIENHFQDDGLAAIDSGQDLILHLGSYSLLPTVKFNQMLLDIGVSAYWEEYFPMSVFAGYKTDQYGNSDYGVDFLQYNIGYPTTSTISYEEVTGSWSYEELLEEYFSPIVRTYEALDNSLITGYDSYDDLENRVIVSSSYDFSDSSVRTYVTFQRTSGGANRPLSDYSISQSIPDTNVLDVTQYPDQFSTKFEVKDNSIIYPPTTIDVNNLSVVVHLDVKVFGIKSNPLNIRRMSLSSKTLESSTFSEIGTRFGTKMYPYSKVGMYFDNKKKNPYAITKESVPYLYLTKTSGIEPLGLREFDIERGVSIPINGQQSQDTKVSAMQLWIRYSDDNIPFVPTTLFSLDAKNIDIGFNIISDSSTYRAKLTSVDLSTGLDYTALTFFQDGVKVLTPYLEKNKWTVIGISFSQPIDFSNYVGSINLFQSAVFNNIVYYRASDLQEIQSVIYRNWESVDGTPLSPLDWQYWKVYETPYGKWDNVLKIAETGIYGTSPEDIYRSYSGTNREIIDDSAGLIVSQDGTVIFASEIIDVVDTTPTTTTRILVTNEPEWSSYLKKPV